MNVRKEPLVLFATVVVVGLLVWPTLAQKSAGPKARKTTKLEVEKQGALAVDVALPAARDLGRFSRDLFVQPRDTQPLPPLDLAVLPMGPLTALRPPPAPAPRTSLFHKFLHADPTPTAVPNLFVTGTAAEDAMALEDPELEAPAAGDDPLTALKGANASVKDEALTPEQREAQMASWKKLYDWIRLDDGAPRFGLIRNEDRFGLRQRTAEKVLFIEVDPATGQEKFKGQEPIPYERARVTELQFAGTVSNHIQEQRQAIGKTITPGQYTAVMEFANWCVSMRSQASEALEVAEEMFRLAQSVAVDDPAPRLGVARCYEAGFEFEKAFEEYQSLLAGAFAHRPEVHVRLAQLESRFRLFDSAEARLREAARIGRTSWEVQWALGRFLYERGRYDEALEHLELAHKFEPGVEEKEARVGIRLDLAAARTAIGKLGDAEGALAMFDQVLQVDSGEQRGLAGKLATSLLEGKPAPSVGAIAQDQVGFELLIDRALADLAKKDYVAARDQLVAAAEADPLRADVAWRALSWLAEITGYPGEALRWIEQAYEADPTDPYTLYQRGRLLLARDDPEGAERDFKAALDREAAFVDVLVALADLNWRRGNNELAERYFDRALLIDESPASVHARRGVNFLGMHDAARAEQSFKRALALDGNQPAARAGIAWCSYVRGDAPKAIEQLAGLDDARRALPDEDPWRKFARGEIKRIEDHLHKELWSDRFERRQLGNSWSVEESSGPTFSLVDGQLVMQGTFNTSGGRARAYQTEHSADFISLEADVNVDPSSTVRVGMYVAKEKVVRGGDSQVQSQISVERHRDGNLELLLMDKAVAEPDRTPVAAVGGVPWWPAGKAVRLRIERYGEGSDAKGRISVDGIPVAEGFPMRSMASAGDLRVGVFAVGDNGLPVKVWIDNVEVVRKVASK